MEGDPIPNRGLNTGFSHISRGSRPFSKRRHCVYVFRSGDVFSSRTNNISWVVREYINMVGSLCIRLTHTFKLLPLPSFILSRTMSTLTQTVTQTAPAKSTPVKTMNIVSNPAKTKFVRPAMPTFSSLEEKQKHVKERLACALRIFGKYGFDEGVAGHITVRDPINPKQFWVNPFGVPFSLMTVSDLLLIDHDGKIVAGGRPDRQIYNRAAYCIHAAIHAARPDVDAAAHSHSIYGKAFSALGRTLDMINQDVCTFYNDHALYPNFGGVVVEEEESANIVKYLGNNKALILQNHGILTVGKTIEETVAWYLRFEKSCQAQLLADAAAAGRNSDTIKIGHEEAQSTHDQIGSAPGGWFAGTPYFEMLDAETNGSYKV